MFIVFAGSSRFSLAGSVLAVQAIVALLVVALSSAMAYRQAQRQVEAVTRTQVVEVAQAIAATDDVVEGLAQSDPASALDSSQSVKYSAPTQISS